jgi:serine protease Do
MMLRHRSISVRLLIPAILLSAVFLLAGLLLPTERLAARPADADTSPTTPAAFADPKPVAAENPRNAVFGKPVPENVADLRVIQKQLQSIVKHLQQCTVCVQIGRAAGSGVIVSEDGFVLTAAHVCGAPGRSVTLILADGRSVSGKTLGMYRTVDAGLIKISDEGKWPFAEMGDSTKLKIGDWCVATGHPGGYRSDRAPVLRLGRVVLNLRGVIQSDCPLAGGDSGGPLFDIDGKVIGINSRIGAPTSWNFHVPVSQYSSHWDRLVASEVWVRRPLLGITGEDHVRGCRIIQITSGMPAEKIGLKAGDIITKLDGKPVRGIGDLAERIDKKKPGDTVKLEILREDKILKKTATLAKPKSLRP